MKTKKSQTTAIIILLIILTANFSIINFTSAQPLSIPQNGEISYGSTNSAYTPWTKKEDAVPKFISLTENYGGTYTSVGSSSSSNNWDIVLFEFGNPNGGTIMIDSFLHGNEFYGYEVLYSVIEWLVTSNDEDANRILQNNRVLVVPVVNYRWGRTNYNSPNWMTTNDPSMDGSTCGVNLNRNFAPGWSSALSSSDSDSYSGTAPDSETETQTLINIWNIYQPKIYWNLHQGTSPMTQCSASQNQAKTDANNVKNILPTIQSQLGVSDGWSFSIGNGGGSYAPSGAAYRGSAGFLTEVMSGWDNSNTKKTDLTTGDTFNQVKSMFIAMCQAIEVTSPLPTSTPIITPSPTPIITPSPTHSTISNDVTFSGTILYRTPTPTNLSVGVNYLSAGNRYDDTNTQLQTDFTRFANDNIKHISIRMMWSVMMPTSTELSSSALNNIKRVLDTAQANGIKVNLDFWTQFEYTLGFPSWAGNDYYSLLSNPTKDHWLNYTSNVVNALKDYPAIASWSILNEPYYSSSSQKNLFQTLMADCVQAIKSEDTIHPVICRFTLSYTPGSGKYDDSIYDLFDAFAVTEYLDPSNPSDTRYNARWSYWDNTVADCKARNKPLWVIEFGDDNTDPEHVRQHYELSLQKFQTDGVEKVFSWAWQTRNALQESFNIYDGENPNPSYYELNLE